MLGKPTFAVVSGSWGNITTPVTVPKLCQQKTVGIKNQTHASFTLPTQRNTSCNLLYGSLISLLLHTGCIFKSVLSFPRPVTWLEGKRCTHIQNINSKCMLQSFKFYRKPTSLPTINATHNERIMARQVGAKYRLHHLSGTSPDSLKNWLMFTFISCKRAQYYISNKTLLNRKQKQCSLSDAGPIEQFIISHWRISQEWMSQKYNIRMIS